MYYKLNKSFFVSKTILKKSCELAIFFGQHFFLTKFCLHSRSTFVWGYYLYLCYFYIYKNMKITKQKLITQKRLTEDVKRKIM